MQFRWTWGAALTLLLAACSYQATLDKLVSRERQAELIAMAQRMCSDPESLSPRLHPEIATTLTQAAPLLPGECPGDGATWQLASYQWRTNVTDELTQRQEEFTVVATDPAATDGSKWTTLSFRLYAENGAPMQISKWTVESSEIKPEALVFIENFEAGAKTMAIVGIVVLLLVGGLIFWLVVRHRRKRAAA